MNQSTSLFHTDGTPHPALRKILKFTGVIHDGTIGNIRDQTQKQWRKGGGYSYEIRDPESGSYPKLMYMSFFEELGLCHEVPAPSGPYRYCLLLGATVKAVRRRLAFLSMEWNRQYPVRFRELFLLGSDRKINGDEERELLHYDNAELPFDRRKIGADRPPKNEYEMMLMVYAQCAAFPWDTDPETATFCLWTFGERANTGDTIKTWLGRDPHPMPGSVLVVSSQPHVGYQESVIRNLLPKGFTVKGIGPAAGESTPVATYLDAMAKWIFEEAKAHGV